MTSLVASKAVPTGTVSRRGLIEGAAVFATLVAIMPSSLAAQPVLGRTLSPDDLGWLARYADAIIPPTDTPGATGAGVVDYIAFLFAAVPTSEQAAFLAGVAALNAATVSAPTDELEQRLRDLLVAPAGEPEPAAAAFLRQLKRLVMIGYYTSEVGGAQELIYAPVPGAYLPHVSVTPETRAVSNDTGALL